MSESHVWFNKAVARWLDIALYKAMQRIIKAVELATDAPSAALNSSLGITTEEHARIAQLAMKAVQGAAD